MRTITVKNKVFWSKLLEQIRNQREYIKEIQTLKTNKMISIKRITDNAIIEFFTNASDLCEQYKDNINKQRDNILITHKDNLKGNVVATEFRGNYCYLNTLEEEIQDFHNVVTLVTAKELAGFKKDMINCEEFSLCLIYKLRE